MSAVIKPSFITFEVVILDTGLDIGISLDCFVPYSIDNYEMVVSLPNSRNINFVR